VTARFESHSGLRFFRELFFVDTDFGKGRSFVEEVSQISVNRLPKPEAHWSAVPSQEENKEKTSPQMIGDGYCGEIGEIKIARGNRSTRENVAQRYFVHHKFHITRPGFEPGPTR
jgi:hypothetical protein